MADRCRIKEGLFDRWIVENADNEGLAWSGARWVPSNHGIPVGDAQISNFDSKEKAESYARSFGFEIVE